MAKIFISYAHADEKWKDRVIEQLSILEMEGFGEIWDDRKIEIGKDWEIEIEQALNNATVAILLISAPFLTSKFIRGKEVPCILERRKKEGLKVFPVLIKPCPWKEVEWLSKIQIYPNDAIALYTMADPEIETQLSNLASLVNKTLKNTNSIKNPSRSGKSVLLTGLPKRKIELLGRERELKELEEKIKRSQRLLLVNGMGGIGKTEVCKRFFMQHYCEYPYAAWVDYTGSFKESLTNAIDKELIVIKESPNVDEQFKGIIKFINGLNGELLLVVDNISQIPAKDAELELLFQFPQHVRVIATSRLTIDGFELYPLDVLSEASCIELFYTFYKGKRDDESVKEIIQLCRFHTLTVELLARTAQNSMKPVKVLLDILKKKGFNLSDAIPETTGIFHGNEKGQKKFFDHLLTVFELTNVTETEEQLLSNISVLPPLYIPVGDIKDWLQLESIEDITASIKKGWLKDDNNFNIYMHPVIGEVVRQRTKPDSSKCATLIDSLTWKLHVEPEENPMDKVPFVIFGETLLRYIHDETKDVSTLANNLSTIYQDMGQLEQALEFGLKANTICEKVLSENHPNLASSYHNLSQIYKDMGQLEQALEFGLKTVVIFEKVLGAEHPDLATSYNNLSLIYKDMGQLEKALEFGLKDLTISEKILGANHPDLATSYNNLSLIYKAMGQLDEALEYQLKALTIRENVLGTEHPDLATSYNNLSTIYSAMGQLEKALEFGLKNLIISKKVLGAKHPSLATSYNNLSTIYQEMGQLEQALEFKLKSLVIEEKVLPPDHPQMGSSYNNLSMIYQDMCQLERALEFGLKALKIKEKGLGVEHPDLAVSYNNLSFIYQDMGQLDKALTYMQKAIAIMEKLFPNGHPNLDIFKGNLARMLKQ